MVSLDNCLKDGLLKPIPPSPEDAANQISKAKVLLREAESSLDNDNVNVAVMAAYAALFDACRAVLFRDGFRERSHVCVVRYLEAKYSKQLGKDTIILLDEYRDKRHKVVYASDYFSTYEEAESLVDFAANFIGKIEKLLAAK